MATLSKTVPHQGHIFQNSKTTFPPLYYFQSRVTPLNGSGEGPQIGDSTGDWTHNLLFHKRIKLELELGILKHMVHWPMDFWVIWMTDDHLLGWHLVYTCDLLLLVCSSDWLYHVRSFLVVLGLVIHDRHRWLIFV